MHVATVRRTRGALGPEGIATILVAIIACGGGGTTRFTPPVPGRALAGTANAIARSVAPTSDGGMIIVGTSSAGGLGGTDVLLVKLGAAANVGWSSFYGGAGSDEGWSVQQTIDGGFILAGVTDDSSLAGGPGGIFLVKTDDAGRPQWQETFGGVLADAPFFHKVAVRQTADEGYVIAGTGPGTEAMNPEPDAYLIKTDPLGNVVWHRELGADAPNTWVEGYDVQQTTDGGYILVGRHEGGSYAIKVDASGATQWEQTFGALTGPIYSVQQTPDGGYVYVGRRDTSSGSAALLVKGDALGQLVWEKTVGPLTSGSFAVTGQRITDGGFVITTRGEGRNGDAYVIRTDASGNELWAKLYGGDGGDIATGFVQRADGGFVVVGSTASFGAASEIYLLRLDGNGVAD
jgi:hypothetical protein